MIAISGRAAEHAGRGCVRRRRTGARRGAGPRASRRHLRLGHAHPARLEPLRPLPAHHRPRVRRRDRGRRPRRDRSRPRATGSWSIRWCRAGHCYACRVGRPNVCANLEVFGVHRDGGFRDLVPVPARNVVKVARDLPVEIAALAEPFSIAANVLSRTGCGPEDTRPDLRRRHGRADGAAGRQAEGRALPGQRPRRGASGAGALVRRRRGDQPAEHARWPRPSAASWAAWAPRW